MLPSLTITDFSASGASRGAAVQVEPPSYRVDRNLADTLLALRPSLADHACKRRGLTYFGEQIEGTTLPHLIEHLAIDLLVERLQPKSAIAGTTVWLDRERGIMQVTLSSGRQVPLDTEAARFAISDAVELINDLLQKTASWRSDT